MKLIVTESQLKKIIREGQEMFIQQETEEFNEKTGESLTPDEYENIMGCTEPDEDINLNLPTEELIKAKESIKQLKSKMMTASFGELIQLKKQLKQLRTKQQNEQVAAPAMVSLMGITMNPGVAIVAAVGLLLLTLFLLGRLLFPRTKVITYRCNKPDRGY